MRTPAARSGMAILARLALAVGCSGLARAAHFDLPDPAFGFRSFYVTWGGTTQPVFEQFLREVRPEIVQCGFYGPMFHGYADDPKSTGYPMRLPVAGQREALAVQREVNRKIHALGLKVVGHFQTVNVIADPARTNGFLDFYANRWPEDLLGPRPHPDVRELLMRDASGTVLSNRHYVTYVGLCPSSPHARALLKQMLKLAIESGLDGIVANYNYRWSCGCPYCQSDFRAWLGTHYSASDLLLRFGITNLAEHAFARIAAQIPGYPAPDASPLDWEAMRWGAAAFKQAFDEVYLDHGRSLKPDLIVATWNHLGDMGYRDERAFTPLDQWGRGENYFWYSGGYGPTQLANRKLGDGWANCLFLREMGCGKPFMLGKYEPIRLRNSIAEALATGGSGMGLYMPLDDPAGTAALAQMLRFPREHADLYESSLVPDADVLLVYPRAAIQAGNRTAAEAFRDLGRALSERQIIFEVGVDGRLDPTRLARSRAVLVPGPAVTDDGLRKRIESLDPADPARLFAATNTLPQWIDANLSNRVWRVESPWTVKAMAWRGPKRRILHLVNYDRDEEAAAALPKKPVAECPRSATNLTCRLGLAAGERVSRIRFHTPEERRTARLRFTREPGAVAFQVPAFPVYGVVEITGMFDRPRD